MAQGRQHAHRQLVRLHHQAGRTWGQALQLVDHPGAVAVAAHPDHRGVLGLGSTTADRPLESGQPLPGTRAHRHRRSDAAEGDVSMPEVQQVAGGHGRPGRVVDRDAGYPLYALVDVDDRHAELAEPSPLRRGQREGRHDQRVRVAPGRQGREEGVPVRGTENPVDQQLVARRVQAGIDGVEQEPVEPGAERAADQHRDPVQPSRGQAGRVPRDGELQRLRRLHHPRRRLRRHQWRPPQGPRHRRHRHPRPGSDVSHARPRLLTHATPDAPPRASRNPPRASREPTYTWVPYALHRLQPVQSIRKPRIRRFPHGGGRPWGSRPWGSRPWGVGHGGQAAV